MSIFSEVKTTEEDHRLIGLIIKRVHSADILSLRMDIVITHHNTPIDLDGLLNAADSDFIHDIGGITQNINRDTGKLENCFSPRYTLCQNP